MAEFEMALRRFRRILSRLKGQGKRLLRSVSADERAYRRIIAAVPELASYKAHQKAHIRARAKEKGCRDLKAYCGLLKRDPEELDFLRTHLTFKGTHFFRGNDWEFFGENCLSSLAGRKRVRVWCASCSSGEEAYSVVLSLLDYVPLDAIEMLASDYNDELLQKCREGRYYNMHFGEIPERYRHYVIPGKPKFTFPPEIVEKMQTRNINLLTDEFPAGFDVVLCRNTLKFFRPEAILAVQKKLAAALNPGGFLFLSEDDGHRSDERIERPGSLGLQELEGRCIYRKAV